MDKKSLETYKKKLADKRRELTRAYLRDKTYGRESDEGGTQGWAVDNFVLIEVVGASGKVLTVDKLLAVAAAIGQAGFEGDEPLRVAFARAAEAALARPTIRIDVDARTVTY